jgi:hypothetical protein
VLFCGLCAADLSPASELDFASALQRKQSRRDGIIGPTIVLHVTAINLLSQFRLHTLTKRSEKLLSLINAVIAATHQRSG